MPEYSEQQRLALDLIYQLTAASEAADWQNADTFVVLTTDDETHAITLNGTWDDPVPAMAWAAEHETELNKGAPPDEIPFRTRVYPVHKPS